MNADATMIDKTFRLNWDRKLGASWMNLDNLAALLYGSTSTTEDLLTVAELPPGAPPAEAGAAESYDHWSILELMGHRKLGGRVREAELGGIPFLRIDVYGGEPLIATQYYGRAAVYCLTPTTEEVARAAGRHFNGPVQSWEMPTSATAQLAEHDDEGFDRHYTDEEGSS